MKKTIVKKDHYESQVENKLVSKHNKYRALVYFITNNLFLPNVYYDYFTAPDASRLFPTSWLPLQSTQGTCIPAISLFPIASSI